MTGFLGAILVVLLLTLLTGLIRIWRGPSSAARMMAAQLLGTTAVAMLLVLSQLMAMPALLNLAMVFALLAAVTLVAFVSLFGGMD
jgi:multicomponent Na+:H+ antiporter subunit F